MWNPPSGSAVTISAVTIFKIDIEIVIFKNQSIIAQRF